MKPVDNCVSNESIKILKYFWAMNWRYKYLKTQKIKSFGCVHYTGGGEKGDRIYKSWSIRRG